MGENVTTLANHMEIDNSSELNALAGKLYTLAYYSTGKSYVAKEITIKALANMPSKHQNLSDFGCCAKQLYRQGKRISARERALPKDYLFYCRYFVGLRVLANLNFDERFLLLLRFKYGFSVKETSKIMSKPLLFIKRALQNILNKTREILEVTPNMSI